MRASRTIAAARNAIDQAALHHWRDSASRPKFLVGSTPSFTCLFNGIIVLMGHIGACGDEILLSTLEGRPRLEGLTTWKKLRLVTVIWIEHAYRW